MSMWTRDSFDFYNVIDDGKLGSGFGLWSSATANGCSLSFFTRFGYGLSLANGNPGFGIRTIFGSAAAAFSSQGTLFCGCPFMIPAFGSSSSNAPLYIQYTDGASNQFAIVFRGNGDIVLMRGAGQGGTAVATYTQVAGSMLANQWNHFQFKVVVSTTVGEFHVRKNGNTVDDFAATGLNTQSTGNATANGIAIGAGNDSTLMYMDDFAAWDTVVVAGDQWTGFVGDYRAQRIDAFSDNSVQWNQNSGGSNNFGTPGSGSTQAVTAGQVICNFIGDNIPSEGGLCTTTTADFNSGFTGKAKMAIYETTATVPGGVLQPYNLLGTSNEVVNPSTGVNTFTFGAAMAIKNGYRYALALLTDTNATVKAGGSVVNWFQSGTPYAGGFPAVFAGSTGTFPSPHFRAQLTTITNFGMLNDFQQDGATTFIGSATAGNLDRFGVEALLFTPQTILGVDLVAMTAKSDAGTRQIQVGLKSGATEQLQGAINPNTTFNYNKYQVDTDPATGVAWTPTGLANVLLEAKVSL